MNLVDRTALYSKKFPDRPPLHVFNNRIDGTWIMGNDYTTKGGYGAYPHGYLDRVTCMFPDMKKVVHLFSGWLPPWLDQVLPMYRKKELRLAGAIGMVKSTNHRFRMVVIFEKVG